VQVPDTGSGIEGSNDVVDFGDMKDKAQDFLSEHDDQVKQGIEKVGDFVGDKIGHDKVDGIQDKLTGLVDKLAGNVPAAPAAAPAAAPEAPADPAEAPAAPADTPPAPPAQ
jgi:hypothetical protein